MRKFWALLGSAIFFVVAPGSVAGLGPWAITRWIRQPPFFGMEETRIAGYVLVAIGAVPLLDSFRRFALEGLGTPAPIAPPAHLVVSGFYRYVRNPMYVGVVAVILGQALALGDIRLFSYAAAIWLAFHLFVLGYEEPALRRMFGGEYKTFRANVPRWLPRLTPWTP